MKTMKNRRTASIRSGERRGELAGWVGMGVNLLLSAGKFALGFLSGSVSVTADAANNLTDCGSCLLIILGFCLSARPADREHPFGHARYEYIGGLMIAIFTLLLGFSFLKESVGRIIHPADTQFSNRMLILLALTAAVKLALAGFYRRVGKSLHSQTLRASAVDSVSDFVLTAVVWLGGLIRRLSGIEADGWIGAIVAFVILFAGGKMIREAAGLLLGRAPDPDTVGRIQAIVKSRPQVLGMHDLMVHSYGEGRQFATAHVEIDARTDLVTAHTIAEGIEDAVLEQTGIRTVVHVDPVVANNPEQISLKKGLDKILRGISPELCYHDFHLNPESGQLCFDLVVPERFVLPDEELISLIKGEIAREYPNLDAEITLDRDFGGS